MEIVNKAGVGNDKSGAGRVMLRSNSAIPDFADPTAPPPNVDPATEKRIAKGRIPELSCVVLTGITRKNSEESAMLTAEIFSSPATMPQPDQKVS